MDRPLIEVTGGWKTTLCVRPSGRWTGVFAPELSSNVCTWNPSLASAAETVVSYGLEAVTSTGDPRPFMGAWAQWIRMRPVSSANTTPPADNASVAAATVTKIIARGADQESLAMARTIRARTWPVTL